MTGEGAVFGRGELERMLDLAQQGVARLVQAQREVL